MDQIHSVMTKLHSSHCFQCLRALRMVLQLVEFGQNCEMWLAGSPTEDPRQIEALVEMSQAGNNTGREKNHGGSHAHYRAGQAIC